MKTCRHVNLTLLDLTNDYENIVRHWRCDDCGHTVSETTEASVHMYDCNGDCIDCPNWSETGEAQSACEPEPVVIHYKI